MFAIFKREFKSYFQTPIGYIFMSLFLLISGIFFVYGNIFGKDPNFTSFLSGIVFVFLLSVPVLTMRLLTDDIRQKTDILLISNPLKIVEIVLGKYLAAIALFLLTLLVTVLYAVVMSFHGDIDTWETVGAYIGFVLLGCSFISIGLFISASTENQVVAAIITFVALLLSWIMDFIAQGVPNDQTAGIVFAAIIAAAVVIWIFLSTKDWIITAAVAVIGLAVILIFYFVNRGVYIGFIGKVFNWLSLVKRFQTFTLGILKLDGIVYYLSISTLFAFLTVRLIEKKRWS